MFSCLFAERKRTCFTFASFGFEDLFFINFVESFWICLDVLVLPNSLPFSAFYQGLWRVETSPSDFWGNAKTMSCMSYNNDYLQMALVQNAQIKFAGLVVPSKSVKLIKGSGKKENNNISPVQHFEPLCQKISPWLLWIGRMGLAPTCGCFVRIIHVWKPYMFLPWINWSPTSATFSISEFISIWFGSSTVKWKHLAHSCRPILERCRIYAIMCIS